MDLHDRTFEQEQTVLGAYPVGVGDRILMAREQVFDLEARLLIGLPERSESLQA
jgi:hypothetical protein